MYVLIWYTEKGRTSNRKELSQSDTMYLQKNPQASIILNGEILENCPTRSGRIKVLASEINKAEIRHIKIWKKKEKVSYSQMKWLFI